MRIGKFPAISVNKGCHNHQQLQPPWMVSPDGTQEEYLPFSSHQTAVTPHGEHWGNLKCKNPEELAPYRWSGYQRNDFSESRLMTLPMHRKTTTSLTHSFMGWLGPIGSFLLFYLGPYRGSTQMSAEGEVIWPFAWDAQGTDLSPCQHNLRDSLHVVFPHNLSIRVARLLTWWLRAPQSTKVGVVRFY